MNTAEEMDADLRRAVRLTANLRTGFYVVVLLIALGGQVTGAIEALDLEWYVALPTVAALELGGIVVLANADVRRRLGEQAVLVRLLSAGIALGAVVFNWEAHANHLEGGFYSGMSLLGYLVYLMNAANKRRDRLRAKRQLPPTPPAYELGHWLRHPWLTGRARSLAKAEPKLGLYDSLDAAAVAVRTERRQAALAKVLRRKIRAAVDRPTAEIAVAVYDLDEVAKRLGEQADYDGLTELIAADLDPARLATGNMLPISADKSADSADKSRTTVAVEPVEDVETVTNVAPDPWVYSTPAPSLSVAPDSFPRPVLRPEIAAVRRNLWRNPATWDGTLADSLSGQANGHDAVSGMPDTDSPVDDPDGLLALCRKIAAELTAANEKVNRPNLRAGIVAAGRTVSSDRLAELVRLIKADADKSRTTNGHRFKFLDRHQGQSA